ncbi:hypothetical protein EMPS_03947 [Entomortierella parvispora]|uniref:Peptide N-acetyl-beta-D-glucosaminyl asparaginase amidase A N-terminal domain-containing protein n=1 Tax=Entomortierella parvispora TaxID=205924 RepID=A0A9P3H8D1_9FUNG|nr:hypothetical protein EMPS_03947 [Entomortierella parvispora]
MRVTWPAFALLAASTAFGHRSSPLPPHVPVQNSKSIDFNHAVRKSNVSVPFEVDVPLKPLDGTKSCTVQLFEHIFANSYGTPYVGTYQPPKSGKCGDSSQWARVTLELVGKARGRQYDRIAGIWIGGAEVLRTSTPEPTLAGIEWSVTKDITSILPLLKASQEIVMELDNVYNSVYNATLNITVSATFTMANRQNPPAAGPQVPDVVLPISALVSNNNTAGWFTLSSPTAVASVPVTVPSNAYRAVVEVYASGHGCDEFWYSNPPNDYVALAGNSSITLCGGGPYRELQVFVDGQLSGVHVPFTTVYTGGIIPTLWTPSTGIHSFNLPPYYFDITPFVGGLVDGKSHNISLAVANSGSYWFIDANLQLWLDDASKQTKGGLTHRSIAPEPTLKIHEKVNNKTLDAQFDIVSSRKFVVQGWVESSKGRVETTVQGTVEYHNGQTYLNDTNISTWTQRTSEKIEVTSKTTKVLNNVAESQHHSHPKPVTTTDASQSTASSQGRVTFIQFADNSFNITATVDLGISTSINNHSGGKSFRSSLAETQNGSGYFWENGANTETLSSANQKTQLKYKDNAGCDYSRNVNAVAQKVTSDVIHNDCK